MKKFIDVRSGIDERDYTVQQVGLLSLPEEGLPEEYKTPFKCKKLNQMFSSQCVAHALATTMAYCEKKEGLEPNDYSRGFTYMMEKKSKHDGPGSNTRELLSCANKYGNVQWDDYMFGNNDCYSLWDSYKKIESYMKKRATCKLVNYFKLKNIEDVKSTVYFRGACIFDYPIFKGNGGFPRRYKKPKEDAKIVGYHSVTCIGWTKDSFICQNSYGILRSEFEVPFDYCDFNKLECWGITIDKTAQRYEKVSFCKKFINIVKYIPKYIKNQFVDWFHK